jgi:hypothetical protein
MTKFDGVFTTNNAEDILAESEGISLPQTTSWTREEEYT